MDKTNKEILYPTLICAGFNSTRNLAILDQEIDLTVLIKFIETNIRNELPKIVERSEEGHSDVTRSKRSPSSQGSGNSSAYSVQMDFMNGNNPYTPLAMRFPQTQWQAAA